MVWVGGMKGPAVVLALPFKTLGMYLHSKSLDGLCAGRLLHPGCTMAWFGYAGEVASP